MRVAGEGSREDKVKDYMGNGFFSVTGQAAAGGWKVFAPQRHKEHEVYLNVNFAPDRLVIKLDDL